MPGWDAATLLANTGANAELRARPLTVVSLDQYRTYNLGLVQFGEDYGNPPTEQMAIAVLATIPVFVLFWVLQRLVNKGFGLSGLK